MRFDGWVPFRLFWQDGEPGVEWMYLGAHRFTEPFFEATVACEGVTPFNSLYRFRTMLPALAEWRAVCPGIGPTGFIHHLSRSGSTLIAQMLAALPDTVVLSEAGVLDRMIRIHERATGASLAQRVAWLQDLVSALGQPRGGGERRLFIKLEPRHILDLRLLRLAYPDVPWIFVYRDPVEVLVSNIGRQCALTTKGVVSLGSAYLDPAVAAGLEEDEYAARMLGIVARAGADRVADSQGLPVNYRQLPEVIWGALGRHFGIEFTAAEVECMQRAADFDAKAPERRFADDSESKRRGASDRVRRLAEEWIAPAYLQLEIARHAGLAVPPEIP